MSECAGTYWELAGLFTFGGSTDVQKALYHFTDGTYYKKRSQVENAISPLERKQALVVVFISFLTSGLARGCKQGK